MTNSAALITLALYAMMLAGVAFWASRQTQDKDAFLLGERNLGPWVAGLAYAASTSSAWVLIGFSGFVYAAGPSALWMVPGILAGYLAIWLFAGEVLQKASRDTGHLTLTDFLVEDAPPALERVIRISASLMIAFAFAWYVAAQLQGAGQAFQEVFGVSLGAGVVLGALLILAYTFFGGFRAVSIIDTIQGLIILFVAILLPVLAFQAAGGLDGIGTALAASPERYRAPFADASGWIAFGLVLGYTATGFGALGQPHLITFIMAAKDRKARLSGAAIAFTWGVLVYAGMAVLGLSARALMGGVAPDEGVFFGLAKTLMPPVLYGVVTAAVLSAIMSTVDSQLLVAGAALGHDLRRDGAAASSKIGAVRAAILIVTLAAVAVTLLLPSSIFQRVLFAWTSLGAAFGPAIVLRALGRRTSAEGVLGAMLIGFGLSVAFEWFLPAGPGAVLQRTLPWIAGFAALLVLRPVRRPASAVPTLSD